MARKELSKRFFFMSIGEYSLTHLEVYTELCQRRKAAFARGFCHSSVFYNCIDTPL